MRNASDVIIKIKNTITARLKIKTSLSRSNLQVLISNLVYRISRIRTTLQRHGNANKFSMAKHLRYFDLHLPVHTHVHTYILERRGLKTRRSLVSRNSRRIPRCFPSPGNGYARVSFFETVSIFVQRHTRYLISHLRFHTV